jgi:D-3-phosphoglycerate dehydrogenase
VPAPVVLVAEELSPAAVTQLEADFDVRHVDGTDRAALLTALATADAIIVRSATRVDAEALAHAARLRVVARAGVGLDNVDVEAATRAGVMVVNAPTSNIVSAAEHAVGLLLAVARNVPQAAASLRDGQWRRSAFTGRGRFHHRAPAQERGDGRPARRPGAAPGQAHRADRERGPRRHRR